MSITERSYLRGMNIWCLYRAMSSLVAMHEIIELQTSLASHVDWQGPLEEWSEDLENRIALELEAVARELLSRSNLTVDQQDERSMAIARANGLLRPSAIGLEGEAA